MSTRHKPSLDDYLADIPSTLGGPSDHPDAILDSSSETSDIDEPKVLAPRNAAAGPSRLSHLAVAAARTPQPGAGAGCVGGAVPRSIINGPMPVPRTPAVEATVGKGGKLEYKVMESPQEGVYYAVQWRKPQTKKAHDTAHIAETWDGDALLRVSGSRCVLLKEGDGEVMGTTGVGKDGIVEGCTLRVGNYEIEVDREVTYNEFREATKIINNKSSVRATPTAYSPATYAKPFKAPVILKPAKLMGGYIPARTSSITDENATAGPSRPLGETDSVGSGSGSGTNLKAVAAKTFYAPKALPTKKGDKVVIGEKSAKMRKEWGGALHNPNEEGAVVMQRPKEEDAKKRNADINDVVLDPLLGKKMRDHQKAGMKFMYSCVMGYTEAEANGCILADEMGLGKTLQTIALILTLLKQSPFSDQSSVVQKALIVCPVSLCANWQKEFKKWVPTHLINAVIHDGTSETAIQNFNHHTGQHVLIIGYERLRKHIKQLASCQPPIGLIVCDEGHRLKSKDNKTTKMFDVLRTPRRIILSGTPVQNDLGEYWAMVDFCCPGLLGTYKQFLKHYEKPITKSREVGASKMTVEDGKMKAEELSKLSKEFVLRRTADVLQNYLPPKTEYVLFVAPSELQIKVYASILAPGLASALIRGGGTGQQGLAMIDLLRKVSNTPLLLQKKDDEGRPATEVSDATEAALRVIPEDVNMKDVSVSGKLAFLDRMLHMLHQKTREKVVVVSNWTATLNVIQDLCHIRKYAYIRLDGSTQAKERQGLVDAFNRETRDQSFIFLLSAKAGGVGLNLIGASRLILFDSDWNPSTDLQAMARIHRDGQKKKVFIYRLLTTNTIDEKIYQITKTGLSDQMLDQKQGKDSKDSFSTSELRDIFTLKLDTDGCQTHDLLQCNCRTNGGVLAEKDENIPTGNEADSDSEDEEMKKGFVHASQYDPNPTKKMLKKQAVEQQQKLAALKNWSHFDCMSVNSFKGIEDSILYNTMWERWEAKDTQTTGGSSEASTSSSSGANSGITDVSEDEWRKAKRAKKSFLTTLDEENEASENEDRVTDSADEGSAASDASSQDSAGRRKRKRMTKARPANSRGLDIGQEKKLYSLAKIAKDGGAGTVMFAFERRGESKLFGSREGTPGPVQGQGLK